MTKSSEKIAPRHPGEVIKQIYVIENGFSGAQLGKALNVSTSAINRVIKGQAAVTPRMAIKLSQVLHGTPESWMQLQMTYDLWEAREEHDVECLAPLISKDAIAADSY